MYLQYAWFQRGGEGTNIQWLQKFIEPENKFRQTTVYFIPENHNEHDVCVQDPHVLHIANMLMMPINKFII